MHLSADTKGIQSSLARYCRDAQEPVLPGVTPGRLSHYRRLVFNIIQDSLETSYPIAYKYIDDSVWNKMVFEFFKESKCKAAQIWQMPGEFRDFALLRAYDEKHELPFLNDLLSFEWAETVVFNIEDMATPPFNLEGDLLNESIVFNPEHQILPLQYPVHLMKPTEAKDKKGQYFVLVYREHESGKVQFMDLSVWYAFIIEQGTLGKTLKELLAIAPEMFGNNIDPAELSSASIKFLEELQKRKFILGFSV